MSERLTKKQIEELRRLVNGLRSWCSDEGGQNRIGGMFFLPEGVEEGKHTDAAVVYGDGDHCASVSGNLGLGLEANAYAEFFAFAVNNAEDLLAIADATAEQGRLREMMTKEIELYGWRCHYFKRGDYHALKFSSDGKTGFRAWLDSLSADDFLSVWKDTKESIDAMD